MTKVARKPAELRRLEITNAILRIVGRCGATGLTAASIAQEVGLTSGALFRHFSSIDEMLSATAERSADLVLASFPEVEHQGLPRLKELMKRRVALLREWPGLVWFLMSDQAATRVPEIARVGLAELARQTRGELTAALLEARAAGEVRSDVSVAAQRTVLLGAVHVLARGAGDPTETLADVFQLVATLPARSAPAH